MLQKRKRSGSQPGSYWAAISGYDGDGVPEQSTSCPAARTSASVSSRILLNGAITMRIFPPLFADDCVRDSRLELKAAHPQAVQVEHLHNGGRFAGESLFIELIEDDRAALRNARVEPLQREARWRIDIEIEIQAAHHEMRM